MYGTRLPSLTDKYLNFTLITLEVLMYNKFNISLKAMKEKSKYGIPLSELESGESLTGNYTERSSGASS